MAVGEHSCTPHRLKFQHSSDHPVRSELSRFKGKPEQNECPSRGCRIHDVTGIKAKAQGQKTRERLCDIAKPCANASARDPTRSRQKVSRSSGVGRSSRWRGGLHGGNQTELDGALALSANHQGHDKRASNGPEARAEKAEDR